MKVIKCGADDRKSKKTGAYEDKPVKTLGFRRKRTAQDALISSLEKALDYRFVLICNLSLLDLQPPLVLIGPLGIWAILPSNSKGVFRVNDTVWEELDERAHGFKAVKPNPLTHILSAVKAIEEHLTSVEMETPAVEPVLFFYDAGAHVDSTQPAARIVLADGLPRFIASLFQSHETLEKEDIQKIVGALIGEDALNPSGSGIEIRDGYSLRESPAPKKPAPPSRLASLSREEPEIVRRLSRAIPFTRKQWILLGLLFVVNLIILIALVSVVLIYY